MAKIFGKAEIIAIQDRKLELVEVPEWEASVYVRSMTAAERGRIEADAAKFKELRGKDPGFAQNFTVRVVGLCVCDEKGERLFNDSEVEILRTKNAMAISRIAEVAQRLSGFSKIDLEALEKNLGTAQAGDSATD